MIRPAVSPLAVPALVGASVLAAAAHAATIEVIYTKITGHPTAVVPGAVDLSGAPESIEFRALSGIALSPDGTQWMLDATTMVGAVPQSNRDAIILKGSGATGTMFIQEGQPAIGGNNPDWISYFPSGFGKFNASNEVCLGIRARTVQDGTTSSASASDGQRVLRWTPSGGFTLAFKQGQPYTGGSGGVIGNSVSSFHLLNDGRVGAADTTVNGSSTIHHLFYNSAADNINEVFQTRNFSTVLGLDGVTQHTWGGFTSLNPTEFYTTPDAQHWFAKGTIQGAASTEDVIWAYDGQVRLREGHAIPGATPEFIVGDVFQYFAAGNNWIARGRDNSASSQPDFVVVNGQLVARTGNPITPGSTENWGDTFFAVSINAGGDYIVVGNTTNPDPAADTVMVVNGQAVVAREGDMVDLNGNGLNDDNAFLGRASGAAFDANDAHIAPGGMVYFIGHLRNADGQDLGITPNAFLGPQAFLRVQAPLGPQCGTQDFNGDGDFGTDQDIEAFFACIAGDCCATCCPCGQDFNGDGDFGTDQDIEAFFRVIAGGTC